jgi:hypothetical protein
MVAITTLEWIAGQSLWAPEMATVSEYISDKLMYLNITEIHLSVAEWLLTRRLLLHAFSYSGQDTMSCHN